jgi:hypothetical protein
MTDLSHIYAKLHETRDEFILRARRERDLQTEVYFLRAELAVAKDAYKTMLAQAENDLDAARAELAARDTLLCYSRKALKTLLSNRDGVNPDGHNTRQESYITWLNRTSAEWKEARNVLARIEARRWIAGEGR